MANSPSRAKQRFEPRYDSLMGEFRCDCGAPEAAFIQPENDDHTLVCAACGVNYDTPEEGPWTFAVHP